MKEPRDWDKGLRELRNTPKASVLGENQRWLDDVVARIESGEIGGVIITTDRAGKINFMTVNTSTRNAVYIMGAVLQTLARRGELPP